MAGGAGLMPGVFLGSCAVNWLVFASPLPVAALISATNAVGPWIGAQVTRCLRPSSGLFTRFIGVLGFILGSVLLHAAITATGGMLAMELETTLSARQAYRIFASWWLCDSGGTFFFAPAVLLWLGVERTPRAVAHEPSGVDALVLLGTITAAVLLFAVPGLGRLVRPDVVFLLTVPLSWITLRISLRAAYTLLTLICITATVGTLIGEGPFHGPSVANPLQSVGLMTVLFAMDALTLMALTSERREAEFRLAETYGTLESVATRAEKLRREALTDPLTGVGNRRLFMTEAGTALERARRGRGPFSVILVDLDRFKRLNDTGGHAAGDAALQTVGAILSRLVRHQDIVARIGGDEFAVALPLTDLHEAVQIAERVREALVRSVSDPTGLRPVPLTASFGVAELQPEDEGIEDLLRRADAALYAAKAKGCNRVEPGMAAAG
jgi:diguanylate cyclase (GGDEF)-like protein